MEVDPGELGVVVEHLLEVRDEPDRVGRVAVEAAAELVVDPAVGHRVERPPRDRERPRVAGRGRAPEEELDRHRLGELRARRPSRRSRASNWRSIARGRRVEQLAASGASASGRRAAAALLDERVDEPRRRPRRPRPLLAPGPGDAREDLPERAAARGVGCGGK